jgi:quinoprotein relay system zinc metallohydrolase 2
MALARCRFRYLSAAALAIACGAARAGPLPMQEVSDGNFVFFGIQQEASADNGGAIANVGFVVGERCVAVIDTGGSRAEGERLLAAVRAATPLPVCAVIDTHMHPDHVFGNAAFDGLQPRPDFYGHAKLAAALGARRESYGRALEREMGATAAADAAIVTPTKTVESGSTLKVDLGGRTLDLRAWRTSHTDNDLTVFDERTGTLWAGDLLFAARTPVLDGSLNGWLLTLDDVERLQPRHIVPGHGQARGWPEALDAERRYLRALQSDTRAAIKAHVPLSRAVDTIGLSEKGRWLLYDEYHRRNVAAAYAELEWED